MTKTIYDSDEHGYTEVCLMTPTQATRAFELLSDPRFSGIDITIDPHRDTLPPQKKPITYRDMVVIIRIPYEGVKVGDFHGELCKALNGEMTGATRRERER